MSRVLSGFEQAAMRYKLARVEAELAAAKDQIARLEHQHRNDEFANQMLLAEIERMKNERL